MEELIDQYFRKLNTTTLDRFRALFYETTRSQLSEINERYEKASEPNKELINDDGVQTSMIQWLGDELMLISLYHEFEKKLSITIKCHADKIPDKLYLWDNMKKKCQVT